VTIDYLVLDRPIVHALADLDEYGQSRGFSVDRVDDLLMGPVATGFDELTRALRDALTGEDPEADRRRRVRDLSHTHPGPGATVRLLQDLGLRPEKTGTSGLDPSRPPPG
jgi:CDP-glycerol glycerophosphotransferase (TagB/SpsB family)